MQSCPLSAGSRHIEGPKELYSLTLGSTPPLGKVCLAALERASINIYLVYLFSLSLRLCIWREIHEERMSLSAGLVYQSANVNGAWKGYAVTKLQRIALDT